MVVGRGEIERLDQARYLSLATLKRSGEFVSTPVWFAGRQGRYLLFSAGDAGKVKRLRNFEQCRVAICNFKGRLDSGWMDARARLLERSDDKKGALQALRQKYGWQMKTTDYLSGLTGKMDKRVYISVELEQ
jgi:PPOX class probable F420-dependent enzyme